MKKIIIFLSLIILMFHTYAQEECVEFESAFLVTSGIGASSSTQKIDNCFYLIGFYQSSISVGGITLPAPSSNRIGSYVAKLDKSGNGIWVVNALGQGHAQSSRFIVDKWHNIYWSGAFSGTIQIQGHTLNSNIPINNFERDGFFAKIDSTGQVKWVKVQKGVWHRTIGINDAHNKITLGSAVYSGYPAIIEQDTIYPTGSIDMLVSQFDTLGIIQNYKHAGGLDGTEIYDLMVDSSENVYVVGAINDTTHFDNISIPIPLKTNHSFIAKLNPQLIFEWVSSSYQAYQTVSVASRVIQGKNGNVIMAGRFKSSVTFDNNTLISSANPSFFNSYITDVNAQGQFQNAYQIKGVNNLISDLLLDTDGNLITVGYFDSTVTIGDTTIFANNKDIFVAKLQLNAEEIDVKWLVQSSGDGNEIPANIFYDDDKWYIICEASNGIAQFGEHIINTSGKNGIVATISECTNKITEANPLSQISIYPNPAQAQLTIANLPANSTVSIGDITGKVIYTQQQTKNNTLQIPTAQWSSGMYLLSVHYNGVALYRKVVIE